MRIIRCLPLLLVLFLLCAPDAKGFHAPPWDTGHNSFGGDNGDDDTDPGECGPCKSGSPVEFATGNYNYEARDLLVSGTGPNIDIIREYNSRDMRKGPFGNGWIFPYDEHLLETTDEAQVYAIWIKADGKRDRFTQNPGGSYSPPPQLSATLTKHADNTFSLQDKYGTIRRFNADGRLASVTDRCGNSLTINYDPTGFPSSITDAGGRVAQITKGANGRIDSITDPSSALFRYLYDSAGNLIGFVDPLGNTTTYQYDSKSNLTALFDPRGSRQIALTYDGNNRVATLTQGAETWTYSYLTTPARTTSRDSSGNTFTYFYNATGNITKVTDPLGGSESYVYDANQNLIEITDKKGNKTTSTYDSKRNPLTTIDPLGNIRAYTYESNFNRPLTVRDRLGNTTSYEYDARGNVVKITNPLGQITQFQYDSKGQLVVVVDPAGNTARFSYDGFGNVVSTTDPLGNISTATFDVTGKVQTATDAEGRTSQFVYDVNSRLVRTINALGGITLNEYDASGNIVATTLPDGARTIFDYDSFNRLVRVTNPLNQITSYTYDKKNNPVSKTDPKGQLTQYAYDVVERLIRKTTPSDTTSFTYDSIGNLLTVVDGDSSLTFTPDTLNRITEARTGASAGQPATSIRYTYDAEGNRTLMIDPSGGQTSYSYDALSRLTSITDPAAQQFGFTYDSLSRRTQVTRGGGNMSSYSYDLASRLISLVHTSAAGTLSFGFSFDRVGNRLTQSDSAGTHSYSYDALYRLSGAAHTAVSNPTESYTYDSVGNRTSSHLSAAYTHDNANRLTADAAFDFIYDANGNLSSKTERSTGNITAYTYDAENRLVRINFPAGTSSTYRYDGLGRRIEKNVDGQITRFVYDGQDLLFEYSVAGTVNARYTHGPIVDEVLSVQRGATVSLFETDHLGSVVRVTDGANVKASYVYDSFGRTVSQTGTKQAPFQFQGRESDQESGLYYYRSRYYDPIVGRFINEDPITFAGGLNFYLFARNNPINLLDPFGLRPCLDDFLDGLQTLLDIAGLFPGIGEFFDLGNAGIYALRGDSLNAGLSLGSAIPFAGWGASAAKLGNKAVKATVKEGIYEFVTTSGRKYVGQSSDIDRRLLQHVGSGKVTPEEAARAVRSEVFGGRTAREIAEQRRIDQLGGIKNLENKVNPIGPNRRHLLDQ